jgi:hypothetical protein
VGSEFGLYCPPESRIQMSGPWARSEELSPLYKKIAPDIDRFPGFLRRSLLDEFDERAHGFVPGKFEAARDWLVSTAENLESAHVGIGFDWPEVEGRAAELAARSRRLSDPKLIARLADAVQLTLPLGNRESTPQSIALRCHEPKTWRKSIEKNYTRKAEGKLREIGFIERGGMLYCSDLAVNWYRGKMRAQEAYLRSRSVTDGAVQLELWEVAQKSLSNKSNRRTELMTRMRGFEDYAKTQNHVATFFTLTCPSAYHARSTNAAPGHRSGHNQSFGGYSVREGAQWLSRMWARSRSRLAKLGVTIYGFRVAEPHHDGTPHWHLVLFCAPHHRGILWAVLRSRWLSEYGREPGALVRRATALSVDESKGSATGYLSKYIAKNIDGFETGELTSDEDHKTTLQNAALRVTAWASLHGIRQFQQIGGPPVGVYRELRRQRNPVDLPTIEPARAACDAHEFGRFIEIYGGVDCGRDGNLRPWKETPLTEVKEEVDKKTGEIWLRAPTQPALNAYGEARLPQVVGVVSCTEALETRAKQWRIVRKTEVRWTEGAVGKTRADEVTKTWESAFSDSGLSQNSALGPVSITVPGQKRAPGLSDPFGWTNPNETSTYGPH